MGNNGFSQNGGFILVSKSLFTVILIIILVVSSTHISINTFSNAVLEIKVENLNGIGLPNVTVVVKPSIYSTKQVSGNTDQNGLTIISGFEKSINGTVYVELIIQVYGLSIGLRSIDPSYGKITITLPYMCINGTEIRVEDEYRTGFNGFYKLEYNGITLSYGEVVNGVLKLIYKQYPLLLKVSDSIVINYGGVRNETRVWKEGLIKYRVKLYNDPMFSEEKFSMDLDVKTINSGIIVVDLHPPRITNVTINETSRTSCIRWFQVKIEVNDGVNSFGVNVVNLRIFIPEVGRYVTPSIEKINVNEEAIFVVKFHVFSCNVKSIVVEELKVMDSTGKLSSIHNLIFNITPVERDEENPDSGEKTFTNINPSGWVMDESTPISSGSRTWFNPVEDKGYSFNFIYLSGIFISTGIILYEKIVKKKRLG